MDEKKKTYWINRITEEWNKNGLIWIETKQKYVNGEITEEEVKVISLRH